MASIARAGRVGPALVVLFAALGMVSLAGSTACGPSFQALYECDVRFEHCYALDQGGASTDAMKECWRGWLHGYTYGQSRDRVEYAATRFSELSLDPTLPSVDTPSVRHSHPMVAPLPTSAFAPPPNLAEGHADGAISAQPVSDVADSTPPRVTPVAVQAVRAPPGEQCTGACADRWNGCRRGCADGACEACDRSYRTCVPGCFQEVGQAPRSLR